MTGPEQALCDVAAAYPASEIGPAPLGMVAAEKFSDDGRAVHYIVTHTGDELAARLDQVDVGDAGP